MIKEFCAENYTSIPLAIARGADRIELCDNLSVGGTTPSTGVIEETLSYAGEKDIPVMTIIRPRGGDFVYNDIELKIMHTDLIEAKKLGTDGVVFGCLTPSGWLDEEALELLIETAEGLQITFHMAFDSIQRNTKVIRNIIRVKFTRPGIRPYRTENIYAPFVRKEEPIEQSKKAEKRK